MGLMGASEPAVLEDFWAVQFHACVTAHASSMPSRVVPCCAMLCCAVLCCAVLFCAVLCCAVLCRLQAEEDGSLETTECWPSRNTTSRLAAEPEDYQVVRECRDGGTHTWASSE